MSKGPPPQTRVHEAARESWLSARGRQLIVVVAAVSVIGTFASLLFGQRLTQPTSAGRDTYSTSPVGHRALHDTLTRLGFHVVRHRHGAHAAATAPMLFIEPRLTRETVGALETNLEQALVERAERGLVSVVVLPKWIPADTAGPGVTRKVTPVTRADVQRLLAAVWADPDTEEAPPVSPVVVRHRLPQQEVHRATFGGKLGSFAVEAPWLQSFEVRDPGAAEVLVGTARDALVIERPLARGRIILIADPDVLHSFNLHRSDHAALVAALLREELQTDTVLIDEILHGLGQQPSLAAALGTFPLVLVPFQALVVALACALAGLGRFGAPQRPAPPLGRGPTEVISVAAAVFAAGRPSCQLAAAYVRRVLEDAATTAGLQGRRGRHGTGVAPPVGEALAHDLRERQLDDLAERRGLPRQAHALLRQAEGLDEAVRQRDQDAIRLAQRAYDFSTSLFAKSTRKRTG